MPRAITDKGKGKSAIRPLSKTTRIGILLYAGAKLAAVHGLTDLFEVANRFSAEYGGEYPAELRISHWGANPETVEVECVFESHLQTITSGQVTSGSEKVRSIAQDLSSYAGD